MQKNYGLVTSIQERAELCKMLLTEGKPFGFDIETGYDGPDKESAQFHPEEGFIVGISFTNSTEWARYAPLRHDYLQDENLDNREVALALWPLMNSGLGIAHNAKFELRFMSKWFSEYVPELVGD